MNNYTQIKPPTKQHATASIYVTDVIQVHSIFDPKHTTHQQGVL